MDGTSGGGRTSDETRISVQPDGTTRGRKGFWVGTRVGTGSAKSMSISQSSVFNFSNNVRGTDIETNAHTWSVGIDPGMDMASGADSRVGIGCDSGSVAGIGSASMALGLQGPLED